MALLYLVEISELFSLKIKMADSKDSQQLDPLVVELLKQLEVVVDVKHLNATNILDALVQGMQIVAKIETKTNEQKKIILLDCFKYMIQQSALSQSVKDDLVWVIDEMGPTMIEVVLVIAKKGEDAFKNSKCCKCSCFSC